MKKLSTQLKAAMKEGGPVAAVKVCQQVAQPLTQATGSEATGLRISRTSLKYRNPENAPDAADRAILEGWEKLVKDGKPLPEHHLVSITPKVAA